MFSGWSICSTIHSIRVWNYLLTKRDILLPLKQYLIRRFVAGAEYNSSLNFIKRFMEKKSPRLKALLTPGKLRNVAVLRVRPALLAKAKG